MTYLILTARCALISLGLYLLLSLAGVLPLWPPLLAVAGVALIGAAIALRARLWDSGRAASPELSGPLRRRIGRTSIIIGAISLAVMASGCASGGPISGLKALSADPDLDAVALSGLERCSVSDTGVTDAWCLEVMTVRYVRTEALRQRSITDTTVLRIPSGPLADKARAAGIGPGRRIRASGSYQPTASFAPTELWFPDADVPQAVAGSAINRILVTMAERSIARDCRPLGDR